MSYECDEIYDVYRLVTRRAAREHRCCACGLTITVGERYRHVTTICQGQVAVYKRCGRCETIHAHLREVTGREWAAALWPDETLNCGQSYQEEWGEEPPIELQAAVFATSDEASALLEARR